VLNLQLTDTKAVMAKLLKEEAFDDLLLSAMEILTFASFDVKQKKDDLHWRDIRPFALDIVKKGGAPKSMKLVFSLDKERATELKAHTNFFLNIYYTSGEAGSLIATTGTSAKTFSLDKSGDHLWEDWVGRFFESHQIATEELD